MKNKLNLALMAIVAVMIFCGCEPRKRQNYINNAKTIYLDTISIYGQSHEILLRSTNPASNTNAGGMMHSPECWCGKGGEI